MVVGFIRMNGHDGRSVAALANTLDESQQEILCEWLHQPLRKKIKAYNSGRKISLATTVPAQFAGDYRGDALVFGEGGQTNDAVHGLKRLNRQLCHADGKYQRCEQHMNDLIAHIHTHRWTL